MLLRGAVPGGCGRAVLPLLGGMLLLLPLPGVGVVVLTVARAALLLLSRWAEVTEAEMLTRRAMHAEKIHT